MLAAMVSHPNGEQQSNNSGDPLDDAIPAAEWAQRRLNGRSGEAVPFPPLPPSLLVDPALDLEGGTLLSVEQSEEIDPEDGCKVQVVTYHILSADQTEESTVTKRRKLKVNCTQSLRRVEYTNGKEQKYEEKTVLDNLDALSGKPVVARRMFGSTGSAGGEQAQKDAFEEDPSAGIQEVLLRAQDNFLLLLREKKDALVKMFPEIFSNLRTLPAIFELMPSTVQETVVNEDGSTTTRTKCSKAFSSRYTRQETFVNGVRQECKSRFRAFMEYAGPEGGFCIRLNDNADADLSEEEGNEADDDTRSRISRSGLSEIPDTQSALVVTGRQGLPQLVADPEAAKRSEKAWHAVNEMVESEARYVQKLGLLDKFREEVERTRLLDRRQCSLMFANIASLHLFHEQHLLPQLMDRRREWQGTKKISDVLRKQAPFLKMYSEYTNNYKAATQMFEECVRRKRAFEELVRRMEQLPECEHLSLVSHLICPVQRVMRYQLLLKEYQRHLTRADPDWEDTEQALALVLQAASHANEMMRKLDRYRSVLEVQEQLGNSISLVSPGRELLTRARLWKCTASGANEKVEERVLFVFNDLFLLASERNALMGTVGGGKHKLRAIFAARHTQIYEGANLEREHSFFLRGADSPQGPQRCVELFCACQAEKEALFDTVWGVIQEACEEKTSAESPSTAAPKNGSDGGEEKRNKCCAGCDADFGWYSRQWLCQRCARRFCKRCFFGAQKATQQQHLCCHICERECGEGTFIRAHSEGAAPPTLDRHREQQRRRKLLQVPVDSEEPTTIKASYVSFRGPSGKQLQRFFALRKDFCLYSYKTDKDKCALAMLPLSGCDVGLCQTDAKFGISIRHGQRTYIINCSNESDHAEWLAALLLSANAKLPGEERAQKGRDDDQRVPPQERQKAATIGTSSGRTVSFQPPQQQKYSRKSSNPFSGLMRRSASTGDARVRQLNARNVAHLGEERGAEEQAAEGEQPRPEQTARL